MPTLTVFVVDDHEVVRRGLTDLLNQADGLTVIGAAATAAQALARVPELHPDVAVLDVSLPDGNGVEVCRELRSFSDAYVVLYSALDGTVVELPLSPQPATATAAATTASSAESARRMRAMLGTRVSGCAMEGWQSG